MANIGLLKSEYTVWLLTVKKEDWWNYKSVSTPGYLLSVERRRFHTQPPDHYALLSHLLDVSVSQSSSLVPLHSTPEGRPGWGNLWAPPLLFRRRPPQSNYPPDAVPHPDNGRGLESRHEQGGISTLAPHWLAPMLPSLPPILHNTYQSPTSSCSKGPRGLSVLMHLTSMFTRACCLPWK